MLFRSKRPLSAMTPTIILRDGKLFMTVGAPGGSRIITAVTEVFLNVADFGMNAQDAVDAPRFHHQWQPDTLYLEKGFSPDTVDILKARGFHVDYAPGVVVARVEAIVIDGKSLRFQPGRRLREVGDADAETLGVLFRRDPLVILGRPWGLLVLKQLGKRHLLRRGLLQHQRHRSDPVRVLHQPPIVPGVDLGIEISLQDDCALIALQADAPLLGEARQ